MSNSFRLDSIYSMLLKKGKMSVEDLSETFMVTPTTIRRDLLVLEEKGYILRSRGFAEAIYVDNTPSIFQDEKRRIAKAASTFVQNGMSLALDSGTTVEETLRYIMETGKVTVLDIVTHSLPAALLASRQYQVSMPGGSVLPLNDALVGSDVETFYQNIKVDLAFLGSTGVNNTNGLTISYPLQISVKKKVVECSKQCIALMDSSKYLRSGIYVFCDFSDIDVLITVETDENKEQIERIGKEGVKIILV